MQSMSVSRNKQNGRCVGILYDLGYFILYNFCCNWSLILVLHSERIFKKKIQFLVFLFLSFALEVVRKKVLASLCCSCI